MVAIVQHEQVELSAPLPGAAPSADRPVGLRFRLEIKLNPALSFTVGDQRVVVPAPGSGLPPETPRHRVEQGRFAVPIRPAQAGDVHTLQIKGRHIVAVTQEVPDGEFERDHRARDCIRAIAFQLSALG